MRTSGKRGQLAIIIILALVIVAGVVIFFLTRSKTSVSGIPADLQPVYDYYSSCIQDKTKLGIDIAESQGGHIYTSYIPGSEYAPFSSQLNFLGFPVPYWYYVSQNGIAKQQVPTQQDIEKDIARYVSESLNSCDFNQFYQQGFLINSSSPKVSVSIQDSKVNVNVNQVVSVSRANSSATKNEHDVEVNSQIGKFYGAALDIYNYEQNNLFLENYSVDVLRGYAPVDGVEISCTPKIWKTQDVISGLKDALTANIASIKLNGNYYKLNGNNDKYFVVDHAVDNSVNFLYSSNWPTRIQISGGKVDEALMTADPAGNQQQLGIAGFCYIPYHFVYDLSFPVLIQVYNNNELFQFPVVVVINGNVPRTSEQTNLTIQNESNDICSFATQQVNVNLYDINLNRIDGNVSYQCFNQECPLGESKGGILTGLAPSCYNGYLNIQSNGYADKSQLFSSNSETSADIILDKQYTNNIELDVDNKKFNGNAIISFVNQNTSASSTILLPDTKNVTLSEGNYKVSVYIYGNSSLTLPESTKRECTQVPKSGLFGIFGATEDKCVDVTIPATTIGSVILGGGSSESYILPSELETGKINIGVSSLPTPNSLEQLQYNFEAFDQMGATINFG